MTKTPKTLPRLAYPVEINFCVNLRQDVWNYTTADNIAEVRRSAKLHLELDGKPAYKIAYIVDAKGREFKLVDVIK